MSVPLIRWEGPDAYVVAFSTRRGGVSDGPYESLNLGRSTRDRPENADENRRRLCETLGVEPERLALNRQVGIEPAAGAAVANGNAFVAAKVVLGVSRHVHAVDATFRATVTTVEQGRLLGLMVARPSDAEGRALANFFGRYVSPGGPEAPASRRTCS
jgi:hypothetical protein